jgi:hypothetical protein
MFLSFTLLKIGYVFCRGTPEVAAVKPDDVLEGF